MSLRAATPFRAWFARLSRSVLNFTARFSTLLINSFPR